MTKVKQVDIYKQQLEIYLSSPSYIMQKNGWTQAEFDSNVAILEQKIEASKREVWKDIKDIENYQVSSLGRVRSLDKYIKQGNSQRFVRGRVLKTRIDSSGYELVSIAKKIHKNVHRLVAETFIPNPENKPQVNHIDKDTTNNSVDNLEWVTSSENMNHSYADGARNTKTKLTDEQIVQIYNLAIQGLNQGKIGDMFGVSRAVVSAIKLKKAHKSVLGRYING